MVTAEVVITETISEVDPLILFFAILNMVEKDEAKHQRHLLINYLKTQDTNIKLNWKDLCHG